ncbi:MAG: ABC transporter permease [Verrucomicrobia bacterium]|nr:ABC transporter permease [Verrucomicrobiota bacterium]
MSFLTIVLKNLLRRRTRSLLTIAGISIGIAAVVALTSIAWGFEKSWEQAYRARGTDLVVTKITSQSPLPSPFSEKVTADLLKLPRVKEVGGLLTDLISIEDAPTTLVFGWTLDSFLWDHLKLVKGRKPAGDDEKVVVIGTVAADMLRKSIGAKIQIEADEFTVCGVFESAALVENGAVIMSLRQLQRVTDNAEKVNFLNVKLEPGSTPEQIESLRKTIKERFAGFNAFTSAEVAQSNTAIQAAKGMSWATSLIALIVGAVGVTNTMLMSVFERIHEIGILLAIGWRRSRIVRMILYESMALSFLGGLVGVAIGFVAIKVIQTTPMIHGKIEGEISAMLFGLAILIALGLGVFGGLYPAVRGSRLPPTAALRYE